MDLLTALKAGVNDYLTKGPYLDLATEITRMADQPNEDRCPGWYPDSIVDMGLFRSLGLTYREMEILSEYARDFPRYRELSKRNSDRNGTSKRETKVGPRKTNAH